MVRIAVIDSGVDDVNLGSQGIHICNNDLVDITFDIRDRIGHGTAVCDIIKNNCAAELYIVRIYDNEFSTTSQRLVTALEYIYKNVDCDIILISSGIQVLHDIKGMESIVKLLSESNIFIVSAFDNEGSLSYPAAFNDVVGVDVDSQILNRLDYIFVENSPINIIGSDKSFRAQWIGGKKIIVNGSSYTSAGICATIANILENRKKLALPFSREAILAQLKSQAIKTISFEKKDNNAFYDCGFIKRTDRMVVFP